MECIEVHEAGGHATVCYWRRTFQPELLDEELQRGAAE
ncbi:hypothetical protein ID866_7728 [Astraeus odoratus]|nr:hypothetical protein ID866_7728 [Astraeus odoratus]